jgi:hypothetical protein
LSARCGAREQGGGVSRVLVNYEDQSFGVAMPDVIEVRYVRDYTVWIKFDDGTQGDVDISRSFKGPVFEPLRDREYFKQVRVNPDLGTIVWPNGADVAPETLYERVQVTA